MIPSQWSSVPDWMRIVAKEVNPLIAINAQGTVANVRTFGALGDGTTDDTAAIQKAINSLSSGGAVLFPRGNYKISSVLSVTADGIAFVGDGRDSTKITQATNNAGIVSSSGAFFALSSLRLLYSGTPASGATAISCTGAYATLKDFRVDNSYIGVKLSGGLVAAKLIDFDLFNYELIGLYAIGVNDVFAGQFIINAGNTSRGALGGIRLENQVEAFIACDGDILLGAYPITTTAASFALGSRPAYNKFSNVYFDSATNPATFTNSVEFDFESCWFSNRPGAGASLSNCDGMRFTGGGAINCGGDGVSITATCKRVVFKNFAARGNSTTTTNTYSGLSFGVGTTDFIVQGCTLDSSSSLGFGTQKYGVFVPAGASDRYIIADNLVSGNGTAGVSDGGTGVNKRVANNY